MQSTEPPSALSVRKTVDSGPTNLIPGALTQEVLLPNSATRSTSPPSEEVAPAITIPFCSLLRLDFQLLLCLPGHLPWGAL